MKISETNLKKLHYLIESSIVKIDENLSVDDFAKAVSLVLKDNYGTLNFKSFINTLKKELL